MCEHTKWLRIRCNAGAMTKCKEGCDKTACLHADTHTHTHRSVRWRERKRNTATNGLKSRRAVEIERHRGARIQARSAQAGERRIEERVARG